MKRRWGIVSPAQIKREKRRAAALHEIMQGLESAGLLAQSAGAAYRACRKELRARRYGMTCRNFARYVKTWKASPGPESLIRKRKVVQPNPPFCAADCVPVVRVAYQGKISLGAAVKILKCEGKPRVPSRGTVLKILPWAVAVDSHAASGARIIQGLAASGGEGSGNAG